MPKMIVTVSISIPDMGVKAALRCGEVMMKPFRGFIEHLVKHQARWNPEAKSSVTRVITNEDVDLKVEFVASEGEKLWHEIGHRDLQQMRSLVAKATKVRDAQASKPKVAEAAESQRLAA